jgi:hypothetical protein
VDQLPFLYGSLLPLTSFSSTYPPQWSLSSRLACMLWWLPPSGRLQEKCEGLAGACCYALEQKADRPPTERSVNPRRRGLGARGLFVMLQRRLLSAAPR